MRKDHLPNVRRGDVLVLAPTLVAAIAMVATGLALKTLQDVWLVNGLPVPVIVDVDGTQRRIEPEGRTSFMTRTGLHRVRVLPAAGGDPIEDGPVDIPSRAFVAYNPLGAAPLYEATVIYSALDTGREPAVTILSGPRVIARDRADFVFEDPPQSIQVKGGQSTSRTLITQAKGGHRATMRYLLEHAKGRQAAEIARGIALAAPADEDARNDALRVVEQVRGADAAIGLIRELLARRPDDFELHRELVYALRRAGRLDDARDEYRARHEKDPASADAATLYARFLPQKEARALLDEVVKAHPESTNAILTAGTFAHVSGDWAASDAYFTKAAGDPRYPRYLDDHAATLVALKRAPEALDLAARIATGASDAQYHAAILYARIARLPESGSAGPPLVHIEKLAQRPGAEGLVAFAASLSGEATADRSGAKPHDEDLALAAKIHLAAGSDPAEAWTLCASASEAALARLDGAVALLLAAEFARAGDRVLAERMLSGRLDLAIPTSAVLDFAVDGTEHPDLWRLDPEWRAALALVRARAVESAGKGADALYDEAERGDLLRGVVTRARKLWKPLAPPRREPKPKRP